MTFDGIKKLIIVDGIMIQMERLNVLFWVSDKWNSL